MRELSPMKYKSTRATTFRLSGIRSESRVLRILPSLPERTIQLLLSCPRKRYFDLPPVVSTNLTRYQGQPAAVRIYNVPNFTTPVSQKNFFKGDKVQLKWNDDGTSLLVLAQTEVDKTGKSYYGETTLYLLSANGGFDSRIDLGMNTFQSRTRTCWLTLPRQRRSSTRCVLVTQVHQLRCCLWLHARENCHLQCQSPDSPHLPSRTPKHRAFLSAWTIRVGGWIWKFGWPNGHL